MCSETTCPRAAPHHKTMFFLKMFRVSSMSLVDVEDEIIALLTNLKVSQVQSLVVAVTQVLRHQRLVVLVLVDHRRVLLHEVHQTSRLVIARCIRPIVPVIYRRFHVIPNLAFR